MRPPRALTARSTAAKRGIEIRRRSTKSSKGVTSEQKGGGRAERGARQRVQRAA